MRILSALRFLSKTKRQTGIDVDSNICLGSVMTAVRLPSSITCWRNSTSCFKAPDSTPQGRMKTLLPVDLCKPLKTKALFAFFSDTSHGKEAALSSVCGFCHFRLYGGLLKHAFVPMRHDLDMAKFFTGDNGICGKLNLP